MTTSSFKDSNPTVAQENPYNLISKADLKRLKKRTPVLTSLMFGLAFLATSAAIGFVFWRYIYLAKPLDFLVVPFWFFIGCMFAHLTELQHELLHGHAFKNMHVNRFLGFGCGVFTLTSFIEYRYFHLLHHRNLGTAGNSEYFNYPSAGYNSLFKLIAASLNQGRYMTYFRKVFSILIGKGIPDIDNAKTRRLATEEYLAYFAILAIAILLSFYFESYAVLICWIIPAVLFAEPVHFLIELPEHFGLNAHSERNVYQNTRTIYTSGFFRWFTNSNNLHVAHHSMTSVPMRKCHLLNDLIKARIVISEDGYLSFFKKVVSGEVVRSRDSY